jgi:putative serine protease PepD
MTAPGELAGEAGAPAPRRPHRLRRRLVIAVAALAVLVLTAFVFFRLGSDDPGAAAPRASPKPSASEEPSTAEIYETLAPSVVTIETASPGGTASGTGVIANAAGVILTALHVVSGGGAIRVTFADGTPAPATIVGADPDNDIAALLPAALPQIVVPAVLGSSGRLAVGDTVIAIGNPLGLTRSTTVGVVSGLDRAASSTDGVRLTGLIQFDAAVNPGSSGGPLVNARGETIGIVVALVNPTEAGTFIGIGFAVPIGTAVATGGGDQGPQQ